MPSLQTHIFGNETSMRPSITYRKIVANARFQSAF